MDYNRIKIYDSQDFPSYLPKLNSLYDDLFSGGKGFRAQLVTQVGRNIGLDNRTLLLLAQTIEFIHNASLLHDDLIDRSTLRRSKTTAWLKYTPEYAVLAGDYLLARVMVNLSNFGNIKLIQLTSQVISDLLEGEWLQDSIIGEWSIQLAQLDRVHNLKTGSLFRWCLRASFFAKDRYEPELHRLLEEMGSILGMLFQRSDDLLDFDIRNEEQKAVLTDLNSGYLNSFGSFLFAGADKSTRARIRKIQSLGEVHQLVGEADFKKKVEEFDAMNSELIKLYAHHLEQLGRELRPEEGSALEVMNDLATLLYWRKKK